MDAIWTRAVAAQTDALGVVHKAVKTPTTTRALQELAPAWKTDLRLLETGRPYAWGAEAIAAVIQASKSIPLDTPLNAFNLSTDTAWWWLETPLPFRTTTETKIASGVRALSLGWFPLRSLKGHHGMPCAVWIDAPNTAFNSSVLPSQTWDWEESTTLKSMLDDTRVWYRKLYGPGGARRSSQNIGEEAFMVATEGLSRFVLAGLAWLAQRVLVVSEAPIERHARKRFLKATGRPTFEGVKVIQLRRAEPRAPGAGEGTVDWACRWVVDGHWRNQACGAGMTDHRLTWIDAYVKGPDDKPLVTKPTVYEVKR